MNEIVSSNGSRIVLAFENLCLLIWSMLRVLCFFFFVRFANVSILHVFAMSVLTSFLYFVLLCDCFVKDIV